ncbi:MAG: hypothetical protein M1829_005324 [Trizodia sp. TS-e1964]|nr:MAG: hypothetical protein M1829_005324 [Trizodia sp. TS-e1964]
MKRVLNSLSRKRATSQDDISQPDGDTPEANISRGIRAFCDSGAANNAGEEVLQLPLIVDTAESSPTAAKEAANLIRKYLSKENYERPSVQYNAVMLMRILTENPGKTFTRNLDAKFAVTAKELIRLGRDSSVQQILRETLDNFSRDMASDEGLKPLIEMWTKEKGKMEVMEKIYGIHMLQPRTPIVPPHNRHNSHNPHDVGNQNYFARNHKNRGLPPPHELAGRVEEAKTSAKLLLQVVQSTTPTEVIGNDLIKEFADRCQSASRSIQGYIHAENPAPDDDTLLTLIETNDQLSLAISKHQRALLQARRELASAAAGPSPSPPASINQSTKEIIHHQDDPFNDENGIVAGLQFPLEPQNYGPPKSLANKTFTQTPYASQPMGLGLSTPTSSYTRRQETAINNTNMRGADGVGIDEETGSISPEETTHAVSYRY